MENFKFHISLHVSNIEETNAFYSRLFGQEPVKTKENYSKYELDNPGLVISFIESDSASPQFGHLGIRVNSTEELNKKKVDLESLLTIELEEKNSSCCYAVQNKFWVKDPDGYEWEVYHFLKDAAEMGGRQSAGNAKEELIACC